MSPALPPLLSTIPQQAASLYSDSAALAQGARTLTYSELQRYSLALSARLRERGVKAGDRVVLALENSLEYVVALFGCLMANAVAVPVSPDTTRARLETVVDHSGAVCSILREGLARKLGVSRNLLTLGELEPVLAWLREAEIPAALAPPDPESLAMILYTSGTTGAPKGVMLSHRNLLANTSSIVSYLDLTSRDSIVTVLPFYYSFGNSVLLTHLAVGGKVIIENRFAFPNLVVETMQRERPTGFSGVPYTFYVLLGRSTFPSRDWFFLRYVSQAGGGLRVEAARQLERVVGGNRIVVMYGQTEAAARLTYLPPVRFAEKAGSAGVAIPGVEIRVVDDEGQPLPTGETGEVVARGENVMQGYWNMPEETAKAIRGGWLYTGDVGRLDGEGFLYLVSRKSDFIKSASYRISPGEIEEVLATAGGVQDVAVFGVPDDLLGEAVAAAVVADEGEFAPARLREHCLGRLPFYKVPKLFFRETRIPRTSSGKTQYFLLREKFGTAKANDATV